MISVNEVNLPQNAAWIRRSLRRAEVGLCRMGAAIELVLYEGIARLEGVAQNVTCDSDQSRLFVGMVGVVMTGRVRTVDSKFQIDIMRMIAVIMGVPVIGNGKGRGMQVECMGSCWHEGEHKHGDAG